MKPTLIALFVASGLAYVFPRGQSCAKDSCLAQVSQNPNGKSDCSSFLLTSIYTTPVGYKTVTSTATSTITNTVTVTGAAKQAVNGLIERKPADCTTSRSTYKPTAIPTYASSCAASCYASACSCLGVTPRSTTMCLPNPTHTSYITITKTTTKSISRSSTTSPTSSTTTSKTSTSKTSSTKPPTSVGSASTKSSSSSSSTSSSKSTPGTSSKSSGTSSSSQSTLQTSWSSSSSKPSLITTSSSGLSTSSSSTQTTSSPTSTKSSCTTSQSSGTTSGTTQQPSTSATSSGATSQPSSGSTSSGATSQPSPGSTSSGTTSQPSSGSTSSGATSQPSPGSTSSSSSSSGTTTMPTVTTDSQYPSPTISTVSPTSTDSIAQDPAYSTTPYTATGTNVLPTTTNMQSIAAATERSFLYSHPNDDTTTFNFNLSLTANTDSTLVNIEDFIPFINSVVCGGSPDTTLITITFSDAAAFAVAQNTWPLSFQLITSGTQYCGLNQDIDRTYYDVNIPVFDVLLNQVTLPVTQISIQEAYSTISAVWGTDGTPSISNRKRKRDTSGSTSFQFSTQAFSTFYDDYLGNILGDLGISDAIVQCDATTSENTPGACGISGTVTLSGGFTCVSGSCPGIFIQATLSDVFINIQYGISVTDINLSHAITIAGLDIPNVSIGLSSAPVFTLSGGLDLVATVGIEVQGVVEIDNIGFTTSLDSASLSIGTSNGIQASGFSLSNFNRYTPEFSTSFTSVALSVSLGPQIGVSFSALSIDYGASLVLNAPTITATLTNDPSLSCNTGDGSANIALDAEVNLVASLTGPGIPSSLNSVTLFDTGPVTIFDNICIAYF